MMIQPWTDEQKAREQQIADEEAAALEDESIQPATVGAEKKVNKDNNKQEARKKIKQETDKKQDKKKGNKVRTFYVIADGVSLLTKRGQLGPGEKVTERDMNDRAVFKKLISKNKIVLKATTSELDNAGQG